MQGRKREIDTHTHNAAQSRKHKQSILNSTFPNGLRLQSAMEYLMTYGWAILIIAVVLGALFQLGVFNASTFAPRAPPGACQVFRPNGPGSTSFINLEGVCSGELPQYVATFTGGKYIQINVAGLPILAQPRTVTLWVYATDLTQGLAFFGYGDASSYEAFYGGIGGNCGGGTLWLDAWDTCNNFQVPASSWVFVAYGYNGTADEKYVGVGGTLLSQGPRSYTSNTVSHEPLYFPRNGCPVWYGSVNIRSSFLKTSL